jgi:hypothetical protein
MTEKYFTRRVIFSHIPKTGGQYIHELIRLGVGNSAISPLLDEDHSRAIAKYGPRYPVLFGHFSNMREMHNTYEHITLIREPASRLISWLFFLINNYDESDINLPLSTKNLITDAKYYIESEGEMLGETLQKTFNVYYTFLDGSPAEDFEKKLKSTLLNLEQYALFGLYEEFDLFIKDLSNFLGIEYKKIESINVTKNKPNTESLSKKLINNIRLHNEFDFIFYEKAKEMYREKKDYFSRFNAKKILPLNDWKKKSSLRDFKNDRVKSVNLKSLSCINNNIEPGEKLSVEVACSLNQPIDKLNFGMQIHDQFESLLFGVNSNIKKIEFKEQVLDYTIQIDMDCYLPVGEYYFGFAIVTDDLSEESHELYWNDSLFIFRVSSPASFDYQLPCNMKVDGK